MSLTFRSAVVASVEGVHHFTCSAITAHEVVAAHGVTLKSDTKQLGFETVLYAVQLLCHNLIQTFCKYLAVALALNGEILGTVVNPDVHDTWVVLCFTHCIDAMRRQRLVCSIQKSRILLSGFAKDSSPLFGMREGSGVEIEFHLLLLSPVNPALEVFHFYLVAVYELVTEVAISLMQIQTMIAGEDS